VNESELQGLLHGVVPDPPRIDPAPLAAAGRRSRSRRRAGLATAAAVAVVVALAPAVLAGSDDRAEAPAVVAPVFDPPPDEVYDAVPCPPELPSTSRSNKTVPDLDRVVGARLCGDGGTSPMDPAPERGPAPSYPASPEALVSGVPVFRDAVRELPAFDPDTGVCAVASGLASRRALALLLDDGTTVLLGHTFCGTNRLAGRPVEGDAVVQAYLRALDAQRDDTSYGLRVVDFGCGVPESTAPVRPGRERVIEAVSCPASGPSIRLAPAGLAVLQDAWQDPRPVTREPEDSDENTCTELDERPRELTLSTDRGDVVRLYESPCGYLVYRGWEPGGSVRIPVTLAELGF